MITMPKWLCITVLVAFAAWPIGLLLFAFIATMTWAKFWMTLGFLSVIGLLVWALLSLGEHVIKGTK